MQVKDIMITDFITVNASTWVRDVFQILLESKKESLPVCDDDGKVIGMIGMMDITELKPGLLVRDIMVRYFVSVDINYSLGEVASFFIMFEKLRQIPVFEDQKLVGIVNRSDVIKVLNKRLPGNSNEAAQGKHEQI
jgi:predicted transcriptional regulator